MKNVGVLTVPFRFEGLRDLVGPNRLSQVLLELPADIERLKQLVAEIHSAGQGKLCFILGSPGSGKTSLAELLPIYLADVIGAVLTPPPDYELSIGELVGWSAKKADVLRKTNKDRLIVLNLDGREIPGDEGAMRSAMVNLNAFLRRHDDILALWPVNSREFAQSIIDQLASAGGTSALSRDPIYEMQGLPRERFVDALHLILQTLSLNLADAAVSRDEVDAIAGKHDRIGDFLQDVHNLVVDRYDIGELGLSLPRLIIAITAPEDVSPGCRILRRGQQFLVDPDRLLQVSRANIVDDWKRRAQQNARKALPFIASLFETRLVNLSPSAVVNACAFGEDEELRKIVRQHYPKPVSSNAGNTMRTTSLWRALSGDEDVSPGSANTTTQIRDAYEAIQKHTNRKHEQINRAILRVVTKDLALDLGPLTFEHEPFGTKALRIDAFAQSGDRPTAIEFTHRSAKDRSEATIASYVLRKVEDYARDYGLL